uniref:Uncharacterized protein n=1 Tax=Parascaris univalens TaxID=6257 RepID=A0A915CHG3_PARUN
MGFPILVKYARVVDIAITSPHRYSRIRKLPVAVRSKSKHTEKVKSNCELQFFSWEIHVRYDHRDQEDSAAKDSTAYDIFQLPNDSIPTSRNTSKMASIKVYHNS